MTPTMQTAYGIQIAHPLNWPDKSRLLIAIQGATAERGIDGKVYAHTHYAADGRAVITTYVVESDVASVDSMRKLFCDCLEGFNIPSVQVQAIRVGGELDGPLTFTDR